MHPKLVELHQHYSVLSITHIRTYMYICCVTYPQHLADDFFSSNPLYTFFLTSYPPLLNPRPAMQRHYQVAVCFILHAAVANSFSRFLSRSPSRLTTNSRDTTIENTRHAATPAKRPLTMGSPSPGFFRRKVPVGLGSWRVESEVESQEPNSMFVFLFDDGSGERPCCARVPWASDDIL